MPVLGTSNNTPDESIGAFRSYVRWRFLKGDGSFTPLNTRFLHLFLRVFFCILCQFTITMPTSKIFSKIPEFPSDVSVINIPTVPFENLKKDIEQDSEDLFEASREYGFFLAGFEELRRGREIVEIYRKDV